MDRTRTYFIIWMCLGGLLLAVLGAQAPAVRNGPVPPMMWLLLVAFVFDGATMTFGERLGLRPLSMGMRLAGVLSGAMLYMLADMTLVASIQPPAPKA